MARKILETQLSPTTILSRGERWGRGMSAKKKGALALAMQGDLGGGKTTFIQGFARGLGIKENITSPTFIILKKFEIAALARPAGALPRQDNLLDLHCEEGSSPTKQSLPVCRKRLPGPLLASRSLGRTGAMFSSSLT